VTIESKKRKSVMPNEIVFLVVRMTEQSHLLHKIKEKEKYNFIFKCMNN